jgi:two-component system sensor histidine kinase PilS (NtrC family)
VAAPRTLWPFLWALNRARLLAALVVMAVGALLRFVGAFPYAFGPFAWTVAATGASCLILPLGRRHVRDPRRFAWFQAGLDLALTTFILAASGGARSIFAPLYVLVVVGACFVLPRQGAVVVAGAAGGLYVSLVLGSATLAWLDMADAPETSLVGGLTVLANGGALLVVAMVTSSLAERFRRSQEHLEAQQKHLSDVQAFRDLIFESVGSGLVAVDALGVITAFNRTAESITGVRARDALGQTWEAVFGRGVDLAVVRREAADEVAHPTRHEFPLRRQDGREVPVGISFRVLRSGRGDVVGMIGVCQDLSAIKQMEQRVRQADRLAAVGRLSANMAHEIRNPLASISGAVETLVKLVPPDGSCGRLADIVMAESERLNHLVRDFLEYARPAPMRRMPADLAEILDEVLLLLEHRSLPANLKVIRQYPESLPTHVDPQQFRQALWNLCINAVQSMPEGGELRVGSACLPDHGRASWLQIWVADTGCGISDEHLPHIFEPFYSTKPEGSGLGLALVYRVLQDHGGQVEVRTRPGEGTAVTLTLPAGPVAVELEAERLPSIARIP